MKKNDNKLLNDDEKALLIEILKKQQPDLVAKAINLDSERHELEVIKKIIGAMGGEDADNQEDGLHEYGAQVERLMAHFMALYLWPYESSSKSWLNKLLSKIRHH